MDSSLITHGTGRVYLPEGKCLATPVNVIIVKVELKGKHFPFPLPSPGHTYLDHAAILQRFLGQCKCIENTIMLGNFLCH
jgi:hypothetical protein